MRDDSHSRHTDRREKDTNRFGGPIGLLDASPDGWAGQIIPGKKQSGHRRSKRLERFYDLGVAQIVLWQGACVAMQVRRYGLSRDAKDAHDFSANCFCNFFVAQPAKSGIGGAACKAGETIQSFRRASGEE
jgi:hypothetical protein